MTSTEQPREHKSLPSRPHRADGALEKPRQHKPRVAGAVWQLEAVRGQGDAEVSRIAEHQRGIVARSQLIDAGLTPAAIKHRLRIGQLHALYPGIYLFGRPRLEPLAAGTAAVIYAEGRGVLSHRTAAAMWGIYDGDEPAVELTTVGSQIRSRPGLIVHRVGFLSQADVRLHRGLPITSPAWTLLDLAGVLGLDDLEAAYALALDRRLTSIPEILDAISRAPHKPGVATLRMLAEQGAKPTLTRSKYERKLRRLLRRAELPQPEVNAKAEGHEVDFLWRAQKVVVEFDGFGPHGGRDAFETDRYRDQRLAAAGYRVLRITARQIDTTPEAVIARLAAALAH